MSKDTIDKVTRAAEEISDALVHGSVAMNYSIAVRVRESLASIHKLVEDLKDEHTEDRAGLIEIIEGLLANWPDTEAVAFYGPNVGSAVLTKDEAFRRACSVLRTG